MISTTKSKTVIESLAVKYRPNSLCDLVGQDHLVSQIRGMFKTKRFPSSLLIAGESGTGKTTTARIIARTLLCKNLGEDLVPCGECISCKYTNNHPDVQEINIADARGIDDIRSLIQASRNMPTIGDNRIFILDECHSLTSQAQATILKPLEEPPARTLWILATTSPEKLNSTILGRCHQFSVRPIPPEIIRKRLNRIARLEGVDYRAFEDWSTIVKTITDLSNGRMRDSIQMLESVIYMIGNDYNVTAQDVIKRFMTTTEAELDEAAARVLVALIKRDNKSMLKEIRSGNARGILNKLRWLLVYLTDNSVGVAKFTPWSAKVFASLAKKTEGITISLNYLLSIQYLLLDIEARMNSINLDDSIIMSSMLGNFVTENARK